MSERQWVVAVLVLTVVCRVRRRVYGFVHTVIGSVVVAHGGAQVVGVQLSRLAVGRGLAGDLR